MGAKQKSFAPETADEIVVLWQRGLSQTAIAERFHTNQTRVRRLLMQRGEPIETRQARGEKHGGWKGGRVRSGAYPAVLLDRSDPMYAMAQRGGYVLESRLVMARYLSRPLYPWETVHHIDGDHDNSDIENLQLRIGRHGKGQVYRCADCGSDRIVPMDLD